MNNHYFKDVSHLNKIDVYRIIELYGITNPCVGHALKKMLCTGNRSGGKTYEQDLREAVDSLNRALQMIEEDKKKTQGSIFGPLIEPEFGGSRSI